MCQGEGTSKKGCEGVKEVRWWGMVKRYKECQRGLLLKGTKDEELRAVASRGDEGQR